MGLGVVHTLKRLCVAALAVAAAACLSGCATPPPAPAPLQIACAAGERPADIVRLFFGRNVGRSPSVSEADWETFLDHELAPRFPEGLSVIDTAGVWRGQNGDAVHELGKAVVIVLAGHPDDANRIATVTDVYKSKFAQESVLTARSRTCVES